jgi:ketosteroid isomerase-like protein
VTPGMADRLETARLFYAAFAAGDRAFVEATIADDFTFSSPPDPHLDRNGYFERCWPHAGRGQTFEFVRLIAHGDEVVVTYEMVQDGAKGRNTEVLTFAGDRISRAEVYFGWSEVGP